MQPTRATVLACMFTLGACAAEGKGDGDSGVGDGGASDGGAADGGAADGGAADGGTGDGGDADADTDADSDSDTDSDTDTDTDADCAYDRWDPAEFTTVIDVGPDFATADPSQVPWESLSPDTLVRIWPEGSPYHHKWAIDVAGTEDAPVVVIGVCDPETGALPVIDADGATTRLALDYWNEDRGLVKIGGTSTGSDTIPAWIFVEDLELRGARAGRGFTDETGAADTYVDNAAAFYVEEGRHLTLRGCTVTDSGNGIFVSSDARVVTISHNHVHGNGNVDSAYEHNSYTEALGITFEYNRYGPLCEGCAGNNLKDRSAETVIRYNWIEGGNRQLDLVDSGSDDLVDSPGYAATHVYGNVLIEHDGSDNSQIVHYGGDSGALDRYRRGTLYFYNNTVVSLREGNTTLVRLSDDDEHLDLRNNILYSRGRLGILATAGTASMSHDWLPKGWTHSIEGAGVVTEGDGLLEGDEPGFVDLDLQDFRLVDGAAPVDAGGAQAAGTEAHPLLYEYLPHQQAQPRADDGALDLGAFER